jgi:hypothetical protein
MGQHLSRSRAEGNDGRQEKVREVTSQKSDEREKEDAPQRNKNPLMPKPAWCCFARTTDKMSNRGN